MMAHHVTKLKFLVLQVICQLQHSPTGKLFLLNICFYYFIISQAAQTVKNKLNGFLVKRHTYRYKNVSFTLGKDFTCICKT